MPAPESPDYDPPLHPSPAKRPKPNEEAMRLHFANITSLGKQVIEWYWARYCELYIFVETYLDHKQHASMCQYFTTRGRQAMGMAAAKNATNDGPHGGILLLRPC